MKKEFTGKQQVLQLEADAAFYGFRKIQDGQGKIRWIVTCSNDGRESSCFHASFDSVNQLLTHFTRQGWIFNRKVSQYCSTQCARSAKEKQKIERKEDELKRPVLPPVPAIQPDPKIQRRIYRALEEHFDDVKKLYREGWSDERISKTEDVSLDFVIKCRREGFGELAEDPEIAKLSGDIKALEELFTAFAQQIGELKHRMDKLSKTHNKASG
jgi:hypothetical protein